jgi:hypothetical protein
MTPEEYMKELYDPGSLPGQQYLLVDEIAPRQGWDLATTESLKKMILERYQNEAKIFPFPKKPRYV